MPKDLSTFFYPHSVAVIGASRNPEKVGGVILKNILDSKFKGKVYPVNPKAEKIGKLKCYKDYDSLPEVPELAVIAVPAAIVSEVLSQIGEKGTKNVVVISAGFKEIGQEGAALENKLIEVAKKYDLNVLGPNCLGFENNLCPINTTFGEPVKALGNIRFISQSGALASGIFDWCNSIGFGFSEFITLGNKAVLNENDILEYFSAQSENSLYAHETEGLSKVNPIGLYLESVSNGQEFLKLTSEISKKDPILIVKPGKTEAAVSAMQSHTGAIAGADHVLEAALNQAGVVRCATLQDFFDLSKAFAWEDVPQGPKVAVISNAGGPSVISADAVVNADLELAKFDDETNKKLEEVLPRAASIRNPVDVLGDALADRYKEALEIIVQRDDVNALVVILTPQIMTQIEKTAENIGKISFKYKKPIFCAFIGGNLVAEGERILNKYKIPAFRYPERAINAVGEMWKFRKRQLEIEKEPALEKPSLEINFEKAKEVIGKAQKDKQKTLDNVEANEILKSVGINTPETVLIENLEQAEGFTRDYGWPVVLKLSASGLLHKTDIGGVITDIGSDNYLEIAWDKLQRRIEELDENIKKDVKVQIQKEILSGVEVIVGVKWDPTFGPVMLFGAGGRFAELIADRNLHLLPIDHVRARELVEKSKIYTILKGYRGHPPYALDALYDLIVRLGRLAEAIPEATDIEINPAIVTLDNVWAVDGKVVLKEGIAEKRPSPQFKVASCLENKVLAAKYHSLEFETQEPLIFKPGQYISVRVAQTAIRSYSIAGHDGDHKFSLLVDTTPGGPGSKFFENVKPGDKMPYLGPFGKFALNLDDGSEHAIFLATGCGCSPIKAMVDAALKEQKTKKPITLYFGLRCAGDAFWQDHFKKLSEDYSNFDFKMAADSKEGDENWQGHIGFITDLVKQDFPDASKISAYMCGSKPMIENATKLLLELGCVEERIYMEKL